MKRFRWVFHALRSTISHPVVPKRILEILNLVGIQVATDQGEGYQHQDWQHISHRYGQVQNEEDLNFFSVRRFGDGNLSTLFPLICV